MDGVDPVAEAVGTGDGRGEQPQGARAVGEDGAQQLAGLGRVGGRRPREQPYTDRQRLALGGAQEGASPVQLCVELGQVVSPSDEAKAMGTGDGDGQVGAGNEGHGGRDDGVFHVRQ